MTEEQRRVIRLARGKNRELVPYTTKVYENNVSRSRHNRGAQKEVLRKEIRSFI